PRTLSITGTEKSCHAGPIPDEALVVSEQGGVRWAVVSIRKISQGKAFPSGQATITLDQKGCRFLPHVIVVPVGQPLRITNGDGILHNVHIHAKRNRTKNIAMAGARKELTVKFRRAERMHVKCDAHPWMSAWIVAAGHPYYAVTGADGGFKLDSVPPGTYQLEAWHETLGKAEQTVTVAKGKSAQVKFRFRK
ncbi:MAG: carboxypeptidase regulatory-like domain-containing protein, partial [Planctomycetota bacterium]